jgi:hypothetical protein
MTTSAYVTDTVFGESRTVARRFLCQPGQQPGYLSGGGIQPWTNIVYHHVVLSVNAGTVDVYLDGAASLSAATSVMNVTNEFSSRQEAFVRLYGNALTAQSAATLFDDGDPGTRLDRAHGPRAVRIVT